MYTVGLLIICAIIASGVVAIFSLAEGLPVITVVRNLLLAFGRGLDKTLFTPYSLLFLVALAIILRPTESILRRFRRLGDVLEAVGPVKFRDPLRQEINPADIPKAILTSEAESKNACGPDDVDFVKALLTRTGAMSIGRFLLYAIDASPQPSSFSLQELAVKAFGSDMARIVEQESEVYDSIALSAAALIQTGLIAGRVECGHSVREMRFENVTVADAARRALKELKRAGFLMVPNVTTR